jgi:uncharacterized Zn finger protein (UPF0148 family)
MTAISCRMCGAVGFARSLGGPAICATCDAGGYIDTSASVEPWVDTKRNERREAERRVWSAELEFEAAKAALAKLST